MNRDSKHNTPQNTISLNARPLSPLLSLPPSSHSGQKIEDTHQALTAPNAAVAPPVPLLDTPSTAGCQQAQAQDQGLEDSSDIRSPEPSPDSNGGHSEGSTTMAIPGAAEKYKERESRPVTGVVVHTAAELSLLWDPSHSAKIASYKS